MEDGTRSVRPWVGFHPELQRRLLPPFSIWRARGIRFNKRAPYGIRFPREIVVETIEMQLLL